MENINVGILKLPDLKIKRAEIHKARGFYSNRFIEHDLLHNHVIDSDMLKYRYPAVQFKRINDFLEVHAYKENGIAILKDMFLDSDKVNIDGSIYTVNERELDVFNASYGDTDEVIVYSFLTPWIGLNQANYGKYLSYNEELRKEQLASILINNIISFCKFTGYTVQNKLKVKTNFSEIQVNLKGETMNAFLGDFMINFELPDFLGLGKSSSRGYGCVKKKF